MAERRAQSDWSAQLEAAVGPKPHIECLILLSSLVALGNSCADFIRDNTGLVRFLTAPIRTDDPFYRLPPVRVDFQNFPKVRAVTVSGFKPVGANGNGYYRLVKSARTWRSNLGSNTFGVDSDPTWIFSALGPKLAGFLGFRFVDDSAILVPNASLFNDRIAALNRLLKEKNFEPILVNWVPEIQVPLPSISDEVVTDAEQYVRMFYFNRSSPYENSQLVHEVAHHSLEILLTESQLQPLLARFKVALDFADFLRVYLPQQMGSTYPLLSQPRNREAIIALLFQFFSRDKDNLSGSIPIGLLAKESQTETPPNNTYFRIGDIHLGSELGGPFRLPLNIKSNRNYTVDDWMVSTLFIHLIPFLMPNRDPSEPDSSVKMGMNLLLKYTERKFGPAIPTLRKDLPGLEKELQWLYLTFKKTSEIDLSSIILAKYSSDAEVINGVASPEHPIRSFVRRAKEMQSVLP